MRVSTISMLLGAAVCAAAAALLATSWFAGGPSQSAAIAKPPEPTTRPVVVATAPLKLGTVLTPEVLAEVPWPIASTPADSFASKSALFAGGQRIALATIAKNEPVLTSKITGPGQRASLSIMIEEGKKAVTIRVDDVLGVAGFVQPDDRVDVLLTRNEQSLAQGRPVSTAPYTDLLLQNVRVLAVDQIADRTTQAKPAKAVTLEVDTADAQKLVLAASIGQLSLALRRAGWSQIGEARRIGLEDLPRSRPVPVEPAATAPAEPSAERGPTVTVFRATERKQYDVSPGSQRLAEPELAQAFETGADLRQDAEASPERQPK
jgi:pilus assembly protein CpaB